MAGIAWCVAPHNDTRGQSTSVADVLTSPIFILVNASRHILQDTTMMMMMMTETEIYNLYIQGVRVSPYEEKGITSFYYTTDKLITYMYLTSRDLPQRQQKEFPP